MLTLYHCPASRSSRIVSLIHEMGIADQIDLRTVQVRRMMTGTGAPDPANPHPEGKVPLLVHDGVTIRESGAIMVYLTDLFPDAGLGVPVGDARRGAYLAWMFWYAGVVEPAIVHKVCELSHPALTATFRGMEEVGMRLEEALDNGPWLMGDRFTAADLLCHSPFVWMPHLAPASPAVSSWIRRCADRPAAQKTVAEDAAKLAA